MIDLTYSNRVLTQTKIDFPWKKDWRIHFDALHTIDSCFVYQLCAFIFFFILNWKQKQISFLVQKIMAVELFELFCHLLVRIGQSFFKCFSFAIIIRPLHTAVPLQFQPPCWCYQYLNVYCNKGMKTVKSIKLYYWKLRLIKIENYLIRSQSVVKQFNIELDWKFTRSLTPLLACSKPYREQVSEKWYSDLSSWTFI